MLVVRRVARSFALGVPALACNSDDLGVDAMPTTSDASTSTSAPPQDDAPAPAAIRNAPFCRGAARADCPTAPHLPLLGCVAPACEGCTQDAETATLFTFDKYDVVVLGGDRSTLVLGDADNRLERRDAKGEVLWSITTDPYQGIGLALAPVGDAFVASSIVDDRRRPTMTAFDVAGAQRWTVALEDDAWFDRVVTDGTSVVAAGSAEQLNTPSSRGFVARFTADGALEWSRKIVEISQITALALAGDEVVVHGLGVVSAAAPRVVRLDASGATRWSFDAESPAYGNIEGLADAGNGNTWAFGSPAFVPWGALIDAEGTIANLVDCDDPIMRTEPDFYGVDGKATISAVRDDGVVAVAVDTYESVTWLARIVDGEPQSARVLGDRFTHVLALRWDDEGELLAVIRHYDGDRDPSQWIDLVVVSP